MGAEPGGDMCGKGSGELKPEGPSASVWGSGILTPLAQGIQQDTQGIQSLGRLAVSSLPVSEGQRLSSRCCHSWGLTSQPVFCPSLPPSKRPTRTSMSICTHTCTSSHLLSWSLSEETNSRARIVERQDLVSMCSGTCAPLPFVYPSGLDGGLRVWPS